MIAIYPGSFDPVTFGHVDLIKRGARIFDSLVIGVAESQNKKPLFSLQERVDLVRASLPPLPNVSIQSFESLLMHFAEKHGAQVIVRGLRAVSDFEFEFQMALMNKKMNPNVETFFMMPDEAYTYLSSFHIKEIARLGGDISAFVPEVVVRALKSRFAP